MIDILIIIADGFNTRAINQELFKPVCALPTFSAFLWEKINKLEELGLIWVEKENPLETKRTNQGRVKEFHILNRLRKFLYDRRKEEFQNAETLVTVVMN